MRQALPNKYRNAVIQVDFAHKDPRPINVLNMGGFQIFVWNPTTARVEKESLKTYLHHLPARMITLRVFSQDHSLDEILGEAAEKALKKHWPELITTT